MANQQTPLFIKPRRILNSHPRRSSSPLPRGAAGFCWLLAAVLGVGAVVPGRLLPALAVVAVPQIPAWLLALDRLARSGPLLDVALLLTPAAVPAELQSDANASPPPLALPASLGAGLPKFAAVVVVVADDPVHAGVAPVRGVDAVDVEVGWPAVMGTEVK